MPELRLKLNRRQLKFINSPAFEILYGGQAGGGKTFGVMSGSCRYALENPKTVQVIFRKTYAQLEQNIILDHHAVFPPSPYYVYNSGKHMGTFANGSVIFFRSLDKFRIYDFQGAHFHVIWFDELTHFTWEEYSYLFSRCRGADSYRKQVISTTNPGGVGHQWVKERFIDTCKPDELTEIRLVNPRTGEVKKYFRQFIPAKLSDNVALMREDPDYEMRLLNLPEQERRRLMDGDWEAEGGRFFPEFREESHTCEPFPIPPSWRTYIALDYGMDMLAAYWIAIDEEGNGYIFREVYEGKDNGMGEGGRGHIASEAAKRVLQENKERFDKCFAPPDLWNRQRDTGRSIAEIFKQNGLNLTVSSNDRIQGWLELKEWLKIHKGSNQPKLKVFKTCPNLIRCFKAIQCHDKKSGDCSDNPHELTHSLDAIRYFATGRPVAATTVQLERPDPFGLRKPKNELYLGGSTFTI